MSSATLTSKGQITLPAKVREALGLDAGDKVDFMADERGVYRLVPRRKDIRVLSGRLSGYATRPRSIEEMNHAVLDEAAQRHRVIVARRR